MENVGLIKEWVGLTIFGNITINFELYFVLIPIFFALIMYLMYLIIYVFDPHKFKLNLFCWVLLIILFFAPLMNTNGYIYEYKLKSETTVVTITEEKYKEVQEKINVVIENEIKNINQ